MLETGTFPAVRTLLHKESGNGRERVTRRSLSFEAIEMALMACQLAHPRHISRWRSSNTPLSLPKFSVSSKGIVTCSSCYTLHRATSASWVSIQATDPTTRPQGPPKRELGTFLWRSLDLGRDLRGRIRFDQWHGRTRVVKSTVWWWYDPSSIHQMKMATGTHRMRMQRERGHVLIKYHTALITANPTNTTEA